MKKYKSFGLCGLVRQARSDRGKPRKIDLEVYKIVEALYIKYPTSSCANIYRMLKPYCNDNGLNTPSYRTVCKIIQLIPDDVITLSHQGTKAYKQKYDLLCIRNANKPNQIWQADHVLLDIEIQNDKHKYERPWLTVVIDDCSRAICGYELSFLSPSAYKTSLCLRHAIWRKQDPKWPVFGIPETLYTDHGSDFTSRHIEQVCVDLKIELIFSQIGQPRGRGKIERFFRTLNQKLIAELRLLNKHSYTISLKKLDSLVYSFIVNYNHNEHSELKLSPIERWNKNGFIPNILDSLEYLDLLLLTEAKPRIIRRDGIHFQGLKYMDVILAKYIGQEIIIRYSPSDITSIRVFYQGKYLCQPVCSELSNQTVSIKEIQQARNKRRYQLKKEIKVQKSLIEAVIEASRKDLGIIKSEQIEEIFDQKDEKPNKTIRLYKDE